MTRAGLLADRPATELTQMPQGTIQTERFRSSGADLRSDGMIVLAQTINLYRVIGTRHDLTDAQKVHTNRRPCDYLS